MMKMINEDDVIRMAWEVWLTPHNGYVGPSIKGLERFAALVVAHEREACAKVCDYLDERNHAEDCPPCCCADAIRARGNT
jgi:hypothetical protein